MRAHEIMTTHVVSVRPDTTIEQAIKIMLDRRISGLPVVDEAGRLVGMVSESDLLRRSELGTERQRPRWLRFLLSPGRLASEYTHTHGGKVDEVMTRRVCSVPESATLAEIVDLMVRKRIKRVPVVFGAGPIGIITRADILRALAKALPAREAASSRSDAEIAADIRAAFDASGCLPVHLIDVRVEDGVVQIDGSITDERERDAARVAVENVAGVKALHDHLVWVEPTSGLVLLSPEDEIDERKAVAASAA